MTLEHLGLVNLSGFFLVASVISVFIDVIFTELEIVSEPNRSRGYIFNFRTVSPACVVDVCAGPAAYAIFRPIRTFRERLISQ